MRPTLARRRTVPAVVLGVVATWTVSVAAADPSPETLRAWDRYIAGVESRLADAVQSAGPFLAIDGEPEAVTRRDELRRGTVFVAQVTAGDADPPSGTIHHWRGAVFIPGATVADVLGAAEDPAATHQEDVLEARVLVRRPSGVRLFLRLRRSLIVSVVYNTEHEVTFRVHTQGRASSRSVATRITEVTGPGTRDERELPPGSDRGLLWRLNSYWRYEAAPDGVFVEVESVSLSRGVPWGLGPVVRPLADHIARESMTRTLDALRTRFTEPTRP